MKEIMQQTLAAPIAYSGIGLHSGKEVAMKLLPGKENTGIVFVRTDLSGHPEIQALAENVSSTVKATTVSENGTEVFTVEHLMAAFSMMGIDNCRIEMSAPEPPVTDGSAAVFCELILQAGRIRQSEPRKIYAVDRAFSVYEGDKYITIQPYDGYRISFVSVNAHPALGTQYFDIELTEEKFLQEIAAARTVGFMSEIKQMQQMGLGLGGSIENVVIFDEKKGTNELDFFDYSNIKGRSGRMMEHYVGKVYNFINIPKEEKIVVDIPFYEQNKDLITDEILVNIPEKDVKPQVRERYDKIYEISSELLDIIKKNGTSVNGQMSIYYALERDIQNGHYNDISWTRMPEYNKMLYILKLAENNTFTCENNKGILSVKQLTMYLNLYRTNGNMMQIIESLYNYKKSKVKNLTAERDSNYYDQAIEEAFHIYRHWFQFTVPKAFRVVDSLQRYVCEKHGKKAGSYSYFVQQLENDFLQENLSILLEYGLPRSLVQKLTKFLPENLSEDEVLNYIIKNKSSIIKILTPYEQERLIACIL